MIYVEKRADMGGGKDCSAKATAAQAAQNNK